MSGPSPGFVFVFVIVLCLFLLCQSISQGMATVLQSLWGLREKLFNRRLHCWQLWGMTNEKGEGIDGWWEHRVKNQVWQRRLHQFKVDEGGLLDGKGTITRRKTYVWPKLSGRFDLNWVWLVWIEFGLNWLGFELNWIWFDLVWFGLYWVWFRLWAISIINTYVWPKLSGRYKMLWNPTEFCKWEKTYGWSSGTTCIFLAKAIRHISWKI